MREEKSQIEIRTGALVEGINKFKFTCHAKDFEGRRLAEAGFTREITLNVIAKKSNDEIMVTINTSAVADCTCDRCLAPVSKILTGSLELCYTFGTPLDGEFDVDDEYRQIDKNTEFIDITEDVCDALLLSIPMKITCINYPNCKLYSFDEGTENDKNNGDTHTSEITSWQESLQKLKNKYH